VDFVNIVNYIIYMDKNNSNNQQNNSQTTNLQELNNHKTRGTYLRDDHCDWGSSGMNEFTKEFSEKN
tara:strand:+ start:134 stop:334 length:201 start_codon:yes stop_codon:yes gene_type:complete